MTSELIQQAGTEGLLCPQLSKEQSQTLSFLTKRGEITKHCLGPIQKLSGDPPRILMAVLFIAKYSSVDEQINKIWVAIHNIIQP